MAKIKRINFTYCRAAANRRKRQSDWTNIVQGLDPISLAYSGNTADNVILRRDTDYEFDILAYEGNIHTPSASDEIQTLPREPGM